MSYSNLHFYPVTPPRIVRLRFRRERSTELTPKSEMLHFSFQKERGERPLCGRWGDYKKYDNKLFLVLN